MKTTDFQLTAPEAVTRCPPPTRRGEPFRLNPPAVIQFSGGRTSALMLRRFLDFYGGTLPPDVHVVFANTGKEREETLRFVRRVSAEWAAPIRWLEYVSKRHPEFAPAEHRSLSVEFREIDFETAARQGEPFEACIRDHQALPNTRMRFCTTDLKIRVAWSFMWSLGYQEWESAIGIRGDEPARILRATSKPDMPFEERRWPFYDASVSEREVLQYWRRSPFDLELAPGDSNCDACMLKGAAIRLNVFRREPWRADWWLRMQERMGAKWTKPGRATYDQLHFLATHQRDMARACPLNEPDDDECFFCTD